MKIPGKQVHDCGKLIYLEGQGILFKGENIGVTKMYECSLRKYFTKFFGEPRSCPEELYAALM